MIIVAIVAVAVSIAVNIADVDTYVDVNRALFPVCIHVIIDDGCVFALDARALRVVDIVGPNVAQSSVCQPSSLRWAGAGPRPHEDDAPSADIGVPEGVGVGGPSRALLFRHCQSEAGVSGDDRSDEAISPSPAQRGSDILRGNLLFNAGRGSKRRGRDKQSSVLGTIHCVEKERGTNEAPTSGHSVAASWLAPPFGHAVAFVIAAPALGPATVHQIYEEHYDAAVCRCRLPRELQ